MTIDPTDAWIDHGWLVRRDGGEAPVPCVMRFLREAELDDVFRLHREILAELDSPETFRADSRDFMARHIRERGRTVGVFCDEHLVAYAVISFPDDEPDNLGRDLPLPEGELRHVADYDGSAVHPSVRGNGLQRRMSAMRHRYALLHGRHHILGTVSPRNPVSLHSFLGIGFRIRNLKEKYGGMLRYLIHRDLREDIPAIIDDGGTVEAPLADIELQRSLLANGMVGHRVVFAPEGPRLRFAGMPADARAVA